MLKLQVIGNIGRDAERKETKSGHAYLQFNVAHDRGKDQPSTWVRVCWFEGPGHRLEPYMKKGAKVAVTGDATFEAYTDKAGQPAVGITLYPDSVDIVLFPKREDAAATSGGLHNGSTGYGYIPAGARPMPPQGEAPAPTGPCPIPTPPGDGAAGGFFGENPEDLPF